MAQGQVGELVEMELGRDPSPALRLGREGCVGT